MKKFKFRLERVLGYRQSVKQDRLRDLLLVQQKLNEAEQRLRSLETAQQHNELGPERILTAHELMLVGTYGLRLRESIASQRLKIVEIEKELEAARAAYIEASKEAEALVKLKERRAEQYRAAVQKLEEQVLDEMTVLKGNRMKETQEER